MRRREGGRNEDKKIKGMKQNKREGNILLSRTVALDLSYTLSSYGEL